MEMEAVVEERTSLEAQLSLTRGQISNLASEVEEQRAKVTTKYLVAFMFFCVVPYHSSYQHFCFTGCFHKKYSRRCTIRTRFNSYEDKGM